MKIPVQNVTKEANMAEKRRTMTSAEKNGKVFRSTRTGRVVSQAQRVAAARTRVVADDLRGVETAPWIVELSKKSA